ncbi:TonB-dependent receptor domain-containing protein [Prevotella sp. HUN102]|uniref:TonB-dependent receptor n=1 Tax=Prevotella sp. HUN102 TaxID=1392486 RepID=UPI0009DD8666
MWHSFFSNIFSLYSLLEGRAFCLFLFISALIPLSSHAQECIVHGRITDGHTGEALGRVYVMTNNNIAAISLPDGTYTIRLPLGKIVNIAFKSLGYETKNVIKKASAPDSIRHDVILFISENPLEEVVVTARSEARKLRESSMPISVISQHQLQGTASSVNEVLARTTGVTVRNTGGVGSASRISVRGLEGKRMGLFMDESPMGQMSNFISLNDIPTDMIERIEVYKGIVPYKFGGSALGGAVNIVTKEYPPFYFDVAYEISSFNTHRLSTILKHTDSKTGIQLGIGGYYTYSDNNYNMRLINLDDRIVRRNHDKFSNVLVGASLKATKWWFDELKYELLFSRTRQEIQGIDMDIREAFNHSSSIITGLTMKRKNFFADGVDFDFDLVYNYGRYGLKDTAKYRYDWNGKQYPAVSTYGGEQGNFPSDGRNKSHEVYGKLNLCYTLDKHHSINLNAYANHTRLLPKNELMDKVLGYAANHPSNMNSFAIGFSYDLALFDNRFQSAFTLKDFFFYSRSKVMESYNINELQTISLNRNHIGWSGSLRYRLSSVFLVKGSFNSEIRIPTSEELLGNGFSILPSTALEPERTTGCNLGFLYHKARKSGGFMEAEINGFYNNLSNMIRFTQDLLPSMARYRNFGSVQTYGIEGEIKGDVLPYLYVYANATYQDLRDTRKNIPGTNVSNPTKNKRIPNIPYMLGNFGMEFHHENLFGGKGQNTRILFDASYIHQYFYDFEVSVNQNRKIPTSFTMNAGIEHSFMNNKWTISIKLKNLTDREVWSELNRPLPRRSASLKIRYLLK